eukprot:TRINITY_DN56092_c0_g1_i1.p1 TRINITY_DN56092_c0_g1~~TRINITY_DN56092_c0_g1_i1.p1  ORF type:complete len:215 (-),score=50.74 TRINITY_DN56092_c0_g1_i1:46-606(-)
MATQMPPRVLLNVLRHGVRLPRRSLTFAPSAAMWSSSWNYVHSRSFCDNAPSDLERSMAESRNVLFPKLQQLETAQEQQDTAKRVVTAPAEEWSPKQLPYRTFDREGDDDGEETDSDDEEQSKGDEGLKAKTAECSGDAADAQAVVGDDDGTELQVGLDEEVGFRYSGPEPTLYGDWAHKGRVTDF